MLPAIDIIRWANRIISSLTIPVFAAFFIGERVWANLGSLLFPELVMLFLIPAVLSAGIVVAWFREVLGGSIIVASVLLFNIASMLADRAFTFNMDFGLFLISGFLFIMLGMKNAPAEERK